MRRFEDKKTADLTKHGLRDMVGFDVTPRHRDDNAYSAVRPEPDLAVS